jgi:signal transduction histidine kinase
MQQLADAPRVKEMLSSAAEAHSDSVAAISQLKSLVARARQGRRPPTPQKGLSCDSGRVVDATVRIVRHEVEKVGRLELVLESSPAVAIEASVLGQVVLNLVLNATQALDPALKNENRITVKVAVVEGAGQISVGDNGTGIAPEHLDRIFDPFFTTKETGTGVGLAISRDLISQVGGNIRVTSELGRGATFTITLPLAKN